MANFMKEEKTEAVRKVRNEVYAILQNRIDNGFHYNDGGIGYAYYHPYTKFKSVKEKGLMKAAIRALIKEGVLEESNFNRRGKYLIMTLGIIRHRRMIVDQREKAIKISKKLKDILGVDLNTLVRKSGKIDVELDAEKLLAFLENNKSARKVYDETFNDFFEGEN